MNGRKLLALGVAFVMVFSTFSMSFAASDLTTSVAKSATFDDVNNHWGKEAINKWSGYGIINGYDGLFRPNQPITRGEMAVILDNMMGYQVAAKNSFNDLTTGQFYTNAVLKANAAGIMKGNGSAVRPKDKITREEAASILGRAFAIAEETGSNTFLDASAVADWAKGSVSAMAAKGYVSGYQGKFNPKAPITRAEVVTIINNIVKAYYDTAGTYTENVAGTAIIKVPNVILKGVTISGNLIIAEGVGTGDATLESVTVKGETVVRGGGENSIHITGNSSITSIKIEKVGDKLRVVISEGNTVKEIEIAEGEEIIISGSVGTVEVNAPNATIYATDANIANANIAGENATLVVGAQSTIGTVTVASTAENTALKTETGAVITTVTSNAEINVSGTGTVTKVSLNEGADGSSITTPKTQTTVATGVTGATGGGGTAIPAGSTGTNGATDGAPATVTPTSTTPKTGGGGSTTPPAPSISFTPIANNTSNPSTVISLTGDTFTTAAALITNWTINPGTTGLTISASAIQGAGGVATGVTLDFAGTSAPGTLSIQPKAAAVTSGIVPSAVSIQILGAEISTTSTIANGALNPIVVVTLANDTFAAAANVQANWTGSEGTTGLGFGSITANSATQVTFQLTGTASAGALTLQAEGAALTNGAASNTLTVVISPVASIASTNPTALTEAGANDGSLASGTVTVTITNGTLADPLVKADVTATNLPAGMDYTVTRTNGTTLTIGITGSATNHANANDVSALTFTIAQAKVTGATGNLTTGNISIDFADPAAPPASIASTNPTALTEAGANDGSLASGTVTVTIANGALADPLVKADVTATNLPAGMDYTVTRNNATTLTIGITGSATNHANANDVSTLTFTIAQAKVTGATGNLTTGNISIDFADPAAPPAELTGLTEDLTAAISPVLASGTYSYTLAAAYNEDQVTLTATLAGSTIKYSYGATANKTVASGTGETIDLGFGANVITISVEKAGCLAASYTLTINRAELSNPDFGMSVAFGSINVSITGLKENGTVNLVDFGDIYEVLSTSASVIRFYKDAGVIPEIELSFDELVSADDSEITFSTTSGAISIKGDIELGTGAFDTGGLFEDFEVFEHDRTEIRLVDASGDWNVSKTVAIPYLEAVTTSSGIDLDVTVTANAAYAGAADAYPYDLPAFLPNFNITGDPATYGAVTINGGPDYVAAKNSAADIGENGIFKVKSWYGEITGHTTGLNNLASLKSSLDAATDTFTFSATRNAGSAIDAAVTLYIMEDNIGTIRYLQISLTGSGEGTGVTVAEVPKGNGDSTITSAVYTVSSHLTELDSTNNSVGSGTKPVIEGNLIGPFLENLQKNDYQGYIVTTADNVPGNASVFGSVPDKDPDTETLAPGDILTILSSDWSTIRSYAINVQSISVVNSAVSGTTPATPKAGNSFTFTIQLRDDLNAKISGLTLNDPTVASISENGAGDLNITGAVEDGTTGNYTITAIYTAVGSFNITATILGQALTALPVTVAAP